MQRTTAFWSKKQMQFSSEIKQAVRILGKVVAHKETAESQELFRSCDDMCKFLEEVKADVHVNGKGYHSKAVLEECLVMCREISKNINDIDGWIDILGLGRDSHRRCLGLPLPLR